MGKLGKDAKDLLLGNDGSDKDPIDFKTELQNAINKGLISKADGTLLISSRTTCDKLAEQISKIEEKEVIREIERISSGEINEISLKYANELRNKKAS